MIAHCTAHVSITHQQGAPPKVFYSCLSECLSPPEDSPLYGPRFNDKSSVSVCDQSGRYRVCLLLVHLLSVFLILSLLVFSALFSSVLLLYLFLEINPSNSKVLISISSTTICLTIPKSENLTNIIYITLISLKIHMTT